MWWPRLTWLGVVLAAVGLVFALLAAGQARRTAEPIRPTIPPRPMPPVPNRLPELFGVVEGVERTAGGGTQFALYRTGPEGAKSEFDGDASRRLRHLCKVIAGPTTPVARREGGPGRIAGGLTVSVWCHSAVAATYPPTRRAEYVVIEPDDR